MILNRLLITLICANISILSLIASAHAEDRNFKYIGYFAIENKLKAQNFIVLSSIKKEGVQVNYDGIEYYEQDRKFGTIDAAYMVRHNTLNCLLDAQATIAITLLDRDKRILKQHDLRPVNLSAIKPQSLPDEEKKILCSGAGLVDYR